MANEYSRLYAISDDLCAVPLVIAEGGSVEELCEQLGYWQYDYATPETLALVRAVLATAKPPSSRYSSRSEDHNDPPSSSFHAVIRSEASAATST